MTTKRGIEDIEKNEKTSKKMAFYKAGNHIRQKNINLDINTI